MKALSLFAGIGGFDLACERLGIEITAQVEIDPFARRVLAKHWPSVRRYEDIRSIVPAELEPCDLLLGGWPCQGASIAGKRGGLGDERTGLFREILRLIDGMAPRPRFLLFENVPGLVSVSGGRDFAFCLGELQRRGYAGCVRVLDAQHFGLAQRRARLFFVFGLGAPGLRAIQLVLEGGVRYPPPRRETGQGIAEGAERGAYSESGPGWWRDGIGTLRAEGENRPSRPSHVIATEGAGVARALNAKGGSGRMDGESETFVVAKCLTANYGKQVDSSDTNTGPPNLIVSRPLLGKPNSGHREDMETFVAGQAWTVSENSNGYAWTSDVAPTLPATPPNESRTQMQYGVIAHTLRGEGFDASEDGTGRGTPIIVNGNSTPETAENLALPLRANDGSGNRQALAFSSKDHGADMQEDLCPTLRAGGHHHSHANAGVPPAVAFTERGREKCRTLEAQEELAYCLTNPGVSRRTIPARIWREWVRRLTPTECEKLQGLPVGHTCLCGQNEGRSVGNPPCVCKDGNRYKAIGNSVAVPVVQWLLARILQAHAEDR